MALNGINNSKGNKAQSKTEDFNSYAKRLNSTFPEQTTTVEEKQRAIDAKKKIMAHPDCPSDSKIQLQKEINIIEKEIKQIKQETSMNTSIFGKRDDLG